MKSLLILVVSGAVGVATASAVRKAEQRRAQQDLWREVTDPV